MGQHFYTACNCHGDGCNSDWESAGDTYTKALEVVLVIFEVVANVVLFVLLALLLLLLLMMLLGLCKGLLY